MYVLLLCFSFVILVLMLMFCSCLWLFHKYEQAFLKRRSCDTLQFSVQFAAQRAAAGSYCFYQNEGCTFPTCVARTILVAAVNLTLTAWNDKIVAKKVAAMIGKIELISTRCNLYNKLFCQIQGLRELHAAYSGSCNRMYLHKTV